MKINDRQAKQILDFLIFRSGFSKIDLHKSVNDSHSFYFCLVNDSRMCKLYVKTSITYFSYLFPNFGIKIYDIKTFNEHRELFTLRSMLKVSKTHDIIFVDGLDQMTFLAKNTSVEQLLIESELVAIA